MSRHTTATTKIRVRPRVTDSNLSARRQVITKMSPEQKAASRLEAKLLERKTKVKQARPDTGTLSIVGVKPRSKVEYIAVEELPNIGVDYSYQRPEDKVLCNAIAASLIAGDFSPAPIHVAIRPDGSKWVVDGQQRLVGHFLAEKPCAALFYDVPSIDLERRMFTKLNTIHRVGASYRIRGWPGPTGDLIRWANENPKSPAYERVTFSPNSSVPAPCLVAGLLALFTGNPMRGSTEDTLRTLDRALVGVSKLDRETRTAGLLRLAHEVFGQQRWRPGPMMALAMAARTRWERHPSCPVPNGRVMQHLRVVNWQLLFPSAARSWIRPAAMEVERRWKEGH
jgi:hypothetical protein